jgi:hypothetical protein
MLSLKVKFMFIDSNTLFKISESLPEISVNEIVRKMKNKPGPAPVTNFISFL